MPRRLDLLRGCKAFLCIVCASCGALAPPFPRRGWRPTLSFHKATLKVAVSDAIP